MTDTEKPFITNVSFHEVRTGHHPGAEVLIQIVDPDMDHPIPAYTGFEEIHKFWFSDFEDEDDSPLAPTEEQAAEIYAILKDCLEHNKNIIVHCVAGLCRSGAVVEVGVMMGFEDTGVFRMPNMRLKRLLIKKAGFGYASL